MRKLAKVLIAVGFSVLAACTLYSEYSHQEVGYNPFRIACNELRVDCSDIKPPIIVYSQIPRAYNAGGIYFHGERYVYVNTWVVSVPWDEIALHETVHYVMYESGMEMGCTSEEAARIIVARVYNKEYDPSWRREYNCPAL